MRYLIPVKEKAKAKGEASARKGVAFCSLMIIRFFAKG